MSDRRNHPLFRTRSVTAAGIVGAALLIAAPAQAADEVGGVGPPGHPPGARLVNVPNSNVLIRLWEEGGASYYALDLGAGFSEPRATSYSLMLRYGAFDPLGDAPAPHVDEALAAGPDTNLHIVQFVTQPLEIYREHLRDLGAEVSFYLVNHSHIVRMDEATRQAVETLPFVRWVGDFHPAYKLDELILTALERGAADNVLADYSIQATTRGLRDQQRIADRIVALGGSVMNMAPDGYRMTVTMTLAQLMEIVRMDEAYFIDPWGPGETDMDIARVIGGAVPTLSGAGITGQGVRGEVFDTEVTMNHPEWGGQLPLIHGAVIPAGTHGSSVFGICFATGVNAAATGMLPNREQGIFEYYLTSTQFGGAVTRLQQNTEATNPAGPYRSVFQTSSVGSPRTTQYTTISAETDDYLFRVDYLSCQSMSNASLQPQTRPQAWAKNIIGVGGVTHQNTLNRNDDVSSGSTGPAADGRVKPDLAHFYDNIFTTTSGTGYTQFGGTSGATPITCGHSGLVSQMWHEGVFPGHGGGPSVFASRANSTTIKALMINTAFRYDWTSGTNTNMTRMRQGWGMVDVGKMYELRDNLVIIDETEVLTNLQTYSRTVTTTAAQTELNVTMVYRDPAGNPGAAMHRINDLTLKVTSPGGTVYWGNNGLTISNFSTPGGAANIVDTVENVFVEFPETGDWTVEVIASEINQDGHLATPQVDSAFALVISGVEGVVPCPWDINGDGNVDVLDLLEVLSNWGPCPTDSGDALGDITFGPVDIEAQVGETGCLGIDYFGGNDTYYVSARGLVVPTHRVHTFDRNGILTGNFDQNAAAQGSAWGYRDGTNDGTLLYFGNENGIFSHNPDGTNPQILVAGAGPNGNWRALAYDPSGDGGNGSFWSANFDSSLVEVAAGNGALPAGTVLNTFLNLDGWSLYGLEIDPRTGDLWGHHGIRPAGGHPPPEIREISTTTGRETGVFFQSDAGVPGSGGDPPLNGGLTMVPGGAGDGQLDTVVVLQALSDTIVGFEIDGVPPCPADINDDGVVDVLDLLELLSHWGPCP